MLLTEEADNLIEVSRDSITIPDANIVEEEGSNDPILCEAVKIDEFVEPDSTAMYVHTPANKDNIDNDEKQNDNVNNEQLASNCNEAGKITTVSWREWFALAAIGCIPVVGPAMCAVRNYNQGKVCIV